MTQNPNLAALSGSNADQASTARLAPVDGSPIPTKHALTSFSARAAVTLIISSAS